MFNEAFNELQLYSKSLLFANFSGLQADCAGRSAVEAVLCLLGYAGNGIGDDGAKAIGSALAPRQNPDGSWVFNEAMEGLELYGKPEILSNFHSLAFLSGRPQFLIGLYLAMSNLALRCELQLSLVLFSAMQCDCICDLYQPHSLPVHCVWYADNTIGNNGAEAIGDALAPRQNPDGSWVFNGALNYLNLGSKIPILAFFPRAAFEICKLLFHAAPSTRSGVLYCLSLQVSSMTKPLLFCV